MTFSIEKYPECEITQNEKDRLGLRLMTLNIEGSRHLEYLDQLKIIDLDFLALQEVPYLKLSEIEKRTGLEAVHFAPNTISAPFDALPVYAGVMGHAVFARDGICQFVENGHYSRKPDESELGWSKYPLSLKNGSSIFPLPIPWYSYAHANGANCYHESGQVRSVIISKLGDLFIATTHFTWTPDGNPTIQQIENLKTLFGIIKPFLEKPFLFMGDLNIPRGGLLYDNILKLGLADLIPRQLKSTLDPMFHPLGNQEIVVDHIFSNGVTPGIVEIYEGLSDHKGLLVNI